MSQFAEKKRCTEDLCRYLQELPVDTQLTSGSDQLLSFNIALKTIFPPLLSGEYDFSAEIFPPLLSGDNMISVQKSDHMVLIF